MKNKKITTKISGLMVHIKKYKPEVMAFKTYKFLYKMSS